MPIKNGQKYRVVNVVTGTALDLSGTDPEHSSVIGWAPHGRENQQWKFDHVTENLYKIKNVGYGNKYLGYAKPLLSGTNAIGVGSAIDWEISEDYRSNTYRISMPRQDLILSLSSSQDGAPAELSPDEKQRWRLHPVISP